MKKQAQLDTWPRSNQSRNGPASNPAPCTRILTLQISPLVKNERPREREGKKNQMIIIMYKRKTEEEEEEEEEERERERELVCVKEREMSIQGKVF